MNNRVMVTGASEGIGREFARQLAKHGFVITVVARNEERLKELCDELGDVHRYMVADLSKAREIAFVQSELKNNQYTLLVNNAGFGIYNEFVSTPLKEIYAMTALNMEALIGLSHDFLCNAQAGDALINVSSTLAFLPTPSACTYAATKAFVTSFSESLWYEQEKRGVYVMALCPGLTKSQFHERAGGKPENFSQAMAQTPEKLVKTALLALKKRSKPTVISGLLNNIFAVMTRLMTRKVIVGMMGKASF